MEFENHCEDKNSNVKLQKFRFNFEEKIANEISEFIKIHCFDSRKTFKEEWEKWIVTDEIKKLVENETIRLETEGFYGDVAEKMFVSCRYYFLKKENQSRKRMEKIMEKETKKEKTIEKKEKRLSNIVLQNIDEHIIKQIKSNIIEINREQYNQKIKVSKISPSNSYDLFCVEKKDIFLNEIHELCKECKDEKVKKKQIETFIQKVKKSYKNRFYKQGKTNISVL